MNSSNKDNKEIKKIKDYALSMVDIMTLHNAFTSKEKIEKKSKKLKLPISFIMTRILKNI